jgi:hypothetical protein
LTLLVLDLRCHLHLQPLSQQPLCLHWLLLALLVVVCLPVLALGFCDWDHPLMDVDVGGRGSQSSRPWA